MLSQCLYPSNKVSQYKLILAACARSLARGLENSESVFETCWEIESVAMCIVYIVVLLKIVLRYTISTM